MTRNKKTYMNSGILLPQAKHPRDGKVLHHVVRVGGSASCGG